MYGCYCAYLNLTISFPQNYVARMLSKEPHRRLVDKTVSYFKISPPTELKCK